jgi:multicomponent Na+:H+ antiporter subunit D
MLIFSGLVFFLFLPLLKRTDTIALDLDWFYRKGGSLLYRGLDAGLNGLNGVVDRVVARNGTAALSAFFANGPARCFLLVAKPYWQLTGMPASELRKLEALFLKKFRLSNFSVASTAIFTVGLLTLLFFC